MSKYLFILAFLIGAVHCGGNDSTPPSAPEERSFVDKKPGDVSHFGNGDHRDLPHRQTNDPYRKDLGFYPLTSPGLPREVVQAADSVFSLMVVGAGSSVKQLDVSGGKGKEIKEKISAMPVTTGYDEMEKIVLIKEIEFCEGFNKIENQKACPLADEIHQSSGFLAGDGHTIWTNAHSVEPNMNFIEKYGEKSKEQQIKEKQRLGVFVFDKNGKLLVNPYVDEVHLAVTPAATFVAQFRKSFYAEDSDYVTLSLPRDIGVPLKIAAKRFTEGDRIYVVGFPACTNCDVSKEFQVDEPLDFADRSPGPNSDGHGVKVSSGTVLNPKGLGSFFGMQDTSMDLWKLDKMVFYTADSNHGNSGGPVLNENGEVVAIHAGGKSRKIGGKLERISRCVVPPEFFSK